jgi:hypothetical protein
MGKSEETKAPKERVYVTFAEKPGLRMITEEDWEKAGVKDHPRTLWGPENDWLIAKEELNLNEEQYARIIRADRNLVEVLRPVEE